MLNVKSLTAGSLAITVVCSLGYAPLFPYHGYIYVGTLLILLFHQLAERRNHLALFITALYALLLIWWYLLPRSLGEIDNVWIVGTVIFGLFCGTSSHVRALTARYFADIIFISACISAAIVAMHLMVPFNIPSDYIDLHPQYFNRYLYFYIERINISQDVSQGILGARFHGMFFEPGAFGTSVALALFLTKQKIRQALLIIFGMLSMSMAFFALVLLWGLTQMKRRNAGFYLLALILAILLFYFSQQSEFFYNSTFGRLLSSGDKVLNTRLADAEAGQIALFASTFSALSVDSFFGIGGNLPGSGGSYRVMLLTGGIGITILWGVGVVYLALTSDVNLTFVGLIRLVCLALLLYLNGNWFLLFYYQIFQSENGRASD